jgi:hypothetical protein
MKIFACNLYDFSRVLIYIELVDIKNEGNKYEINLDGNCSTRWDDYVLVGGSSGRNRRCSCARSLRKIRRRAFPGGRPGLPDGAFRQHRLTIANRHPAIFAPENFGKIVLAISTCEVEYESISKQ